MKCSCHDWNILHHSPNLLNSTLNCIALVVAFLFRNQYGEVVRRSQEASGSITSIVKQYEQLAGFTQLLDVVARSTGQLEGFTSGLSQAQDEWQELQTSLARVGRLEELVGWWRPVQP